MQFNHFLVKDDEPLLFHTGLRGMHAEIREALSKLINVSDLRHISFIQPSRSKRGRSWPPSRLRWVHDCPTPLYAMPF
jgi:hypothetical protein